MIKEGQGMDWSMERLMDLATAYWRSATLSAAVELDLFTALDGKALTAAEAAPAVGAAPRHLGELLCALAALGLVRREGERFSLVPGAARLLSRTSPDCILEALKFNIDLYGLWGQLAKTIRSGAPVLPPTAHLGQSAERTRRFVLGMHGRSRAMAPAILPAINLEGCRTLLDLGAGPGTFGCLLAEKYPALQVTLFDLPPILEVAREIVGQTAVADRIGYHPGDYRADPLPGKFDAVLYCGAVHQEEPAGVTRILTKIKRALRPGGRVWIVDMMLAPGRTAPLFSTLFSLNMALMSAGGRVYEGVELVRLLAESGFVEGTCASLPPSPYWVVRGINAGQP
jgi:ubiquinone/menaquinone biosynthesis C-methylase UbiE